MSTQEEAANHVFDPLRGVLGHHMPAITHAHKGKRGPTSLSIGRGEAPNLDPCVDRMEALAPT